MRLNFLLSVAWASNSASAVGIICEFFPDIIKHMNFKFFKMFIVQPLTEANQLILRNVNGLYLIAQLPERASGTPGVAFASNDFINIFIFYIACICYRLPQLSDCIDEISASGFTFLSEHLTGFPGAEDLPDGDPKS